MQYRTCDPYLRREKQSSKQRTALSKPVGPNTHRVFANKDITILLSVYTGLYVKFSE